MSGALAAPTKNMISGMEPLLTLTGEEFVEVVKRLADGKYKNYRVLASKLRAVSTAYDFAVENGFTGTLAQWLDCTRALYTRDPASSGKILVADGQGVGQWTDVGIGIIEGLQEELDSVLAEVHSSASAAAGSATTAGQSVQQSVAAKDAAQGFAGTAQTAAQQATSAKDAAQGFVSGAQDAAIHADGSKAAAEAAAVAATAARDVAAASVVETQDLVALAEASKDVTVAAKNATVIAASEAASTITETKGYRDEAITAKGTAQGFATSAQDSATVAVTAKDEAVAMRPIIDEMTDAAEVALANTNAALTETRNARDAVVGAEAELDLMKALLAAITADPNDAVVSWELTAKDFNLVQGGATFKAVAARLAGWSMPDDVASYLTTIVSLPGHWATMDVYVKWVNEVANVGNCVLGGEIHKWKVGETMNATPAGGSGVMAANPSPYIVIESKVASSLVLDPSRMTTLRIARQGASANDTLLNAMTILSVRLVKKT